MAPATPPTLWPFRKGRLDHLEAERIAAYLDRALDQDHLTEVEGHLAACFECRREVIEALRILRRVNHT